jgi:hypothetical protein
MAGTVPTTNQEAMMKILQQISVAMAAPDADLPKLAQMQKFVVAAIREPFDTPTQGSPVPGAAMNMSQGAAPPVGPAPGAMSPMLQALMSGGGGGGGGGGPMGAMNGGQAGGLPPGTFQPGGLATRTPPNMDEVRRMLSIG